MKLKYWMGLCLLVSACSSQPKNSDSVGEGKPYSRKATTKTSRSPASSESGNIDQEALQRSLGLERSPQELGFQEKSFSTCEAGYGYSSTHDCEKQHFVVIHFRLQCRDSEGTVSTILSEEDLTPIADRDIKWTMAGRQGIARTDGMGYGQIRAIFPSSQKNQRLKLATHGEFLYVRTGDAQRIVTPKPWCPN